MADADEQVAATKVRPRHARNTFLSHFFFYSLDTHQAVFPCAQLLRLLGLQQRQLGVQLWPRLLGKRERHYRGVMLEAAVLRKTWRSSQFLDIAFITAFTTWAAVLAWSGSENGVNTPLIVQVVLLVVFAVLLLAGHRRSEITARVLFDVALDTLCREAATRREAAGDPPLSEASGDNAAAPSPAPWFWPWGRTAPAPAPVQPQGTPGSLDA